MIASGSVALRAEIEADLILMPTNTRRALLHLAAALRSGQDEQMPVPSTPTLMRMFIAAVRGVGGGVEDVRWLESAGYAPPGTLAEWDDGRL